MAKSSRTTSYPAIRVRLPKAARFSKVSVHPSTDEKLAAAGRKVKTELSAAAKKVKE